MLCAKIKEVHVFASQAANGFRPAAGMSAHKFVFKATKQSEQDRSLPKHPQVLTTLDCNYKAVSTQNFAATCIDGNKSERSIRLKAERFQ